jgi:5-methylthioadenosine/S-adenosylhomocysteine deaminase
MCSLMAVAAEQEADIEVRCRKTRELCGRKSGVYFTQDGHNAGSVATALRHGLPVPELLDAGVLVGLGSDGTAPNRSADMWRHMQQCMHYHRRFFQDSDVLPPGKVLEMCTIDAAAVLGMADVIGSLEVGKYADLICVNLAAPHLVPLNMPVSRAIYFANGADVDTVFVGGQLLMKGRHVLSVDEATVLQRATAEAGRAIARLGLENLLQDRAGFWGLSRFPAEGAKASL